MADFVRLSLFGAVLGNVALGFSAFHTLSVNRTLLPRSSSQHGHAARIDRMWRFLLRHHRDGAAEALIPVSTMEESVRALARMSPVSAGQKRSRRHVA